MKRIKSICTVPVLLLMAACTPTNDFSDLQRFTTEVRGRPGGEIEPVPEFKEYEAFTYSAAGFRSPFDIPIRINLQEGMSASQNVKPDLDRVKEPLESFAIAELAMVGMVERNGHYVALVENGLGEVHRVLRGNYLGRNFGRVVSISATQLDIVEIVPSGSGGWMERPQSLTLVR
ncbi:MAG: pilus assembly protein PilP [Gammaproteobacteria bacterium]|nr:pilus assembly protein PilP [Pseudomonadales bacterium]MCP5347281.1 pilus assembly protein PilP [Pseudomonadales bacterium]